MNARELADWYEGAAIHQGQEVSEQTAMICRALRLLAAAEGGEGTPDIAGLVEALGHQQQCDEDGVMCIVSRQAVDEASTTLASLAARVKELGSQLSELSKAHQAFISGRRPDELDKEVDALVEEWEKELEKDAERYRWLRDNQTGGVAGEIGIFVERDGWLLPKQLLRGAADAAIDAARSAP